MSVTGFRLRASGFGPAASGLALLLLLVACAHATKAPAAAKTEPAVDVEAMREATDSFEPQRYVSARAYRHYLDALLAKGADDYAAAAAELREALLYDPESPHLHTQLADVLLKQGRVADAEEELRAALAIDAAHAPAQTMLARIAEARDRPVEARAHLRAAIEGNAEDPDAYRELVRLELSLANLAAAEAVAVQLSTASRAAQERAGKEQREEVRDEERGAALVVADRLRDQAAGAWVDVARAFVQRHDEAGAKRAFAQARAAQPSDAEALSAEASFLESQRKYAEARELFLRLLAQRPEAPEVLAALARLALEEGDLETVGAHARKLLGLAGELDPWDGTSTAHEDERRELAGALLRVAVPLLGARRSAEAQDALDGALRLYPDHPELLFYRAMALVQRGHAREGALAFEQVEKRLRAARGQPPSPELLGVAADALALDARVQAALAHGRAGDVQESLRRMRALFAEQPEDEGVPLALLEAFDRAGKAAEAEQLLAASARAHPGSDALLYALANAQDRKGERQKALGTMRKVLALQPAHAGALNYIGYTLAEEGGPAALREAETLLSRAVELRPDDGAIADSYGFCLLKLGREEQALAELRRADRLAPGDPVILSHLGDALLASGKRDEALDAFRRALSRLSPAPHKARRKPEPRASIDAPDRLPEPGDAKVRAELEGKLKALQGRRSAP
jgi:tetratricopeptide (TPR) repeat protein